MYPYSADVEMRVGTGQCYKTLRRSFEQAIPKIFGEGMLVISYEHPKGRQFPILFTVNTGDGLFWDIRVNVEQSGEGGGVQLTSINGIQSQESTDSVDDEAHSLTTGFNFQITDAVIVTTQQELDEQHTEELNLALERFMDQFGRVLVSSAVTHFMFTQEYGVFVDKRWQIYRYLFELFGEGTAMQIDRALVWRPIPDDVE